MSPEPHLATQRRRTAILTLTALLLLGVYAQGVWKWWFIGDDAYISFRYARHLTQGHGLVWNPGEPVEGYTNFSWVMLMALGLWAGIPPTTLAPALGIAAGLITLFVLGRAAQRTPGASSLVPWVTLAFLVTNKSFQAWSTSGLETMLYTLLVTSALLQGHTHGGTHPRAALGTALLLSAAMLTRPDAILFVGLIGLYQAYMVHRGQQSLRHLITWCAPIVATVGTHTLFRWLYYGDLLPNTFYAKVTGIWWQQGLTYLQLFHEDHHAGWYAWLALIPVWRHRRAQDLLLLGGVALQLLYVVYVGGDRFDFRFVVPVMPALFLLICRGIDDVVTPLGRVRSAALFVAAITLAAGTVFEQQQPKGLIRHDVEQIRFIRAFARRRAAQGQHIRYLVRRGFLPDDLRLAVGAAGALPYYADVYTLDVFGLNDREIARQKPRPGERRIVAHEKHATPKLMRARGIHMWDATGWMTTPHAHQAATAWSRSFDKLGKLRAMGKLRRVCRRVDGLFLTFLTPMTPAEVDAMWSEFEDCGPFLAEWTPDSVWPTTPR